MELVPVDIKEVGVVFVYIFNGSAERGGCIYQEWCGIRCGWETGKRWVVWVA